MTSSTIDSNRLTWASRLKIGWKIVYIPCDRTFKVFFMRLFRCRLTGKHPAFSILFGRNEKQGMKKVENIANFNFYSQELHISKTDADIVLLQKKKKPTSNLRSNMREKFLEGLAMSTMHAMPSFTTWEDIRLVYSLQLKRHSDALTYAFYQKLTFFSTISTYMYFFISYEKNELRIQK